MHTTTQIYLEIDCNFADFFFHHPFSTFYIWFNGWILTKSLLIKKIHSPFDCFVHSILYFHLNWSPLFVFSTLGFHITSFKSIPIYIFFSIFASIIPENDIIKVFSIHAEALQSFWEFIFVTPTTQTNTNRQTNI